MNGLNLRLDQLNLGLEILGTGWEIDKAELTFVDEFVGSKEPFMVDRMVGAEDKFEGGMEEEDRWWNRVAAEPSPERPDPLDIHCSKLKVVWQASSRVRSLKVKVMKRDFDPFPRDSLESVITNCIRWVGSRPGWGRKISTRRSTGISY